MNAYMCVGRLNARPKRYTTKAGDAVASFEVDIADGYNGRAQVVTLRCVAFGRTAEVVLKYTERGKEVLLTGRLQWNAYEGDDGVDYSSLQLVVSTVSLGSDGRSRDSAGSGRVKGKSSRSRSRSDSGSSETGLRTKSGPYRTPDEDWPTMYDDDGNEIPF